MTRLILLDRDGVINRDSDAFVKSAAEFIPLPGAMDAIARLHKAGFTIAVCTNQSGIGRGLLTEAVLADIHRKLFHEVEAAGGHIDAVRHCPHLPEDGCDCRKPRPGLLEQCMRAFDAAASDTGFVGESQRDLEAAAAAGCRPGLVRTGHGRRVEAWARRAGCNEVYDDLLHFASAEIDRQQGVSGLQQ